jgi:glycosyltransferase involved in cell wall biosynthesis
VDFAEHHFGSLDNSKTQNPSSQIPLISVLILTLNEEVNIGDCLDSVSWADDVLVLDSGSTDRTVEIAESKGARVMYREFDDFASQRNYGLQEGELQHEWVLHLDADERVTPALKEEILRTASSTDKDAFRVPSKLIFQDQWLKHAGMYPTYQVRFGRQEALSFTQVGHGQRGDLDPERLGTLEEPLLHYAFSKGVDHWFERHNRYSTDEARHARRLQNESIDWQGLTASDAQRRRRALKDLSYRLPFRPLLRFLYMYVGRLGFLDGRAGLDYCLMLAVYEYMTMLKMRTMDERPAETKGNRPKPSSSSDGEPAME